MKDFKQLHSNFESNYKRSLELQDEFMEMTRNAGSIHLMDEFMRKITLSYLYAHFGKKKLEKIAEIDGCDDIEDLFYSIGCTIDDECLDTVSSKFLKKYPNALKI